MRISSAFVVAFAVAGCGRGGVPQGATGLPGETGATGLQGETGAVGPLGVRPFGYFFALMPGDNSATIALGGAVDFPQNGAANGIFRVGVVADEFVLPAVGMYEISWQVSITEAGQLVLALDNVEQPRTTAGRATLTTQIMNHVILETTAANTVLSIRNPAAAAAALTVTPGAGGASAVSASLVIKQLQ